MRLLKVDEVCAMLGVSRRHLYRHLRHAIPTVDVGGQCVRYDERDVVAWVESQKRWPPEEVDTPAATVDPRVQAVLDQLQRRRERSKARSRGR